jgi:hypothetical protein
MSSYGYFPGSGWDWFPESERRPEQELVEARKARDNTPGKVLSEMALVFGASLAVVLLIDVAVILASAMM